MSVTITLPISPPIIDFVVFTNVISAVVLKNANDHVVVLDSQPAIPWLVFKNLFYYQSDMFTINPAVQVVLLPYISFHYQTVNGVTFCLAETIFQNIEADLGMSRLFFSACSNIALNKQLNAIQTLSDIVPTSTIVCSMSWSDIVSTVKCCDSVTEVIFVLTVFFNCPTPDVYPTCIKFQYLVDVTSIA